VPQHDSSNAVSDECCCANSMKQKSGNSRLIEGRDEYYIRANAYVSEWRNAEEQDSHFLLLKAQSKNCANDWLIILCIWYEFCGIWMWSAY